MAVSEPIAPIPVVLGIPAYPVSDDEAMDGGSSPDNDDSDAGSNESGDAADPEDSGEPAPPEPSDAADGQSVSSRQLQEAGVDRFAIDSMDVDATEVVSGVSTPGVDSVASPISTELVIPKSPYIPVHSEPDF